MNRERILAIASAIEKHELPLAFDMQDWKNDYGTSACIAGWAYALEHGVKALQRTSEHNIEREASKLLSMDWTNTCYLFSGSGRERSTITPAEAIATLRHLAETGKVDWTLPGD